MGFLRGEGFFGWLNLGSDSCAIVFVELFFVNARFCADFAGDEDF